MKTTLSSRRANCRTSRFAWIRYLLHPNSWGTIQAPLLTDLTGPWRKDHAAGWIWIWIGYYQLFCTGHDVYIRDAKSTGSHIQVHNALAEHCRECAHLSPLVTKDRIMLSLVSNGWMQSEITSLNHPSFLRPMSTWPLCMENTLNDSVGNTLGRRGVLETVQPIEAGHTSQCCIYQLQAVLASNALAINERRVTWSNVSEAHHPKHRRNHYSGRYNHGQCI
jgi:hypothetical protein